MNYTYVLGNSYKEDWSTKCGHLHLEDSKCPFELEEEDRRWELYQKPMEADSIKHVDSAKLDPRIYEETVTFILSPNPNQPLNI